MEIKMEEVYIIMITVKLLTMVTGKTIKSMGSVLFPVGNSFMKANGHTIIDLVTVTFWTNKLKIYMMDNFKIISSMAEAEQFTEMAVFTQAAL